MRVLLIKVKVKREHIAEFIENMQWHANESRLEEGCVHYEVMQSEDDPSSIYIYEIFRDEAAQKIHNASDNADRWREVSSKWREGAGDSWDPENPPYTILLADNLKVVA